MSSVNFAEINLESAIVRSPLTIASDASVADAIALLSVGSTTCSLSCDIDSALQLQLAKAKSSCVLVLDHTKLVGILTERDLVRLSTQGRDFQDTSIASVMTYPVQTLQESAFTDIFVPLSLLQRHHIRHLPLVSDLDEVVGLLTHESLRQLLRPIDLLRLRLVSEVMVTEVISAEPTDPILTLTQLMSKHRVSSVVIVETREGEDLFPIGVVTEHDIVQLLALGLDFEQIYAQTVMSAPVFSVRSDTSLWEVRALMQERQINRIVVTDVEGRLEGIVTQTNLLDALNPLEICDLVATLETKLSRLEQENLELLQNRNIELEKQVRSRTEALFDSNEMFRQFAENNRSTIIISAVGDEHLLYVNPAYAEIFGRSNESLYADPTAWMDAIAPHDRERVTNAYRMSSDVGFFSQEFRIILPDGTMRWLWARCFPIHNAGGEIYRTATIIENISDRKLVEENLHQYKRVIANTADGIALVNRQYIYQLVNQVYLDRNAKTFDEIIGHSVAAIHGEQTFAEIIQPKLDRCFAGETVRYESWFNYANLGDRFIAVTYSPYVDANGEISGATVSSRDITELKTAELEISQQREFLHTIIETSPNLIFVKDWDGKYLLANQAIADFYGMTTIEMIGKYDFDIHPDPDSVRKFHEENQAVIASGQALFIPEEKSTSPLGQGEWLQWQKHPITILGQDSLAVLAIGVNITHRKAIELALQDSESKQRALIVALPDLIMRMSGDGIFLDFFANEAFKAFGNSDIVGKSIYEIGLSAEFVEMRMRYIQQALQTGQVQIYDQKIFINDELRTQEVRLVVCGDNEVLAIARDITDRKEAEESLQNLVEGAAAVTGENFLPLLAEYIATALDIRYVVVSKRLDENSLETLIFWEDGQIQPNLRLCLDNSPCAIAMEEGFFSCLSQVQQRFAGNEVMESLGVKSYMGIGLTNSRGEIFGSLCILDRKPLLNQQRANDMLCVFAARVSAELERQEAIDALYQLNKELESRVEKRTLQLEHANHQLLVEMSKRQKLIALVENSTDFIALATQDGQLTYLNSAGRQMIGLNASIRDLSIFDFHFPEDRLELQKNTLGLLEHDGTWAGEFRLRHYQTHEAIPVLFSAFFIQNSWIDKELSLACIVRDISDRKRAEEIVLKANEQLLHTNRELARATRLKDEFLANMSHELRTPLNAILGMSEGMLDEVFGSLNDRQRKAISTIESSGNHLLELITDILDVSKIEAGKLELEISEASIDRLCKSSLSFVRQLALKKNIQLTMTIPTHLNLSAIAVDERRIRQVLINLLSNAVKFTPSGGQVTLEVRLENLEGQIEHEAYSITSSEFPWAICFLAIDTGIGIAPENMGKLFQTFVQIDSSLNRKYEGTGLGLTLVKQITELHGGCVTVKSVLGEGSCFSVWLPYSNQAKESIPPVNQPVNTPVETVSSPSSLATKTLIFQVADRKSKYKGIKETISNYLTSRGYRLVFAKNEEESIAIATAETISLILIEIQIPELDELRAIQQIRANPKSTHIPIVAIADLELADSRETYLQTGADEFLVKPIKLKQLAETIQQLLATR
ncbi:PAS domain S-box protein [Tumidithrix elongata RA019]|uniref:Circadian input-output histidine kinase CikA n=1 Tax=Tumidithrix elongata BACA0141 TaxID=2716417 RepID=A0AAW9Q1X8_9CYAN|nr:PAS domain S-box protein [Tumidithrix elongata RA019]